jgi:RNA methyltransferase, TrmH family
MCRSCGPRSTRDMPPAAIIGAVKRISSRQNPLVRRLREAVRKHEHEIVIEGRKQVADALAGGWRAIAIVTADSDLPLPPGAAAADRIALTQEIFDSISDTRSSQGVLGLFERPEADAASILATADRIAIALDGVQDPGNVGTIVRLAAAFEASGVLLLPGCADPFGPKAIRASAGAILRVPVASISPAELMAAGLPIVAAAMTGAAGDPPSRSAVLLFGNEGSGVSELFLRRAATIAIPMSPDVESLNVASAAAILLARSYALRHA